MLKMPKITKSNNAPMALAYVITASKALRRTAFLACTFLLLLAMLTLSPLYIGGNNTEAAKTAASLATTSLSLSASDVSLSFSVDDPKGTFATTAGTENGSTISVNTDNYTGYLLTLTPSGTGINQGDNIDKLVSGDTENSNTFSPISSATSASDFSNPNNTSYNNRWAILPSYYNSAANTYYLPAPTTTAVIEQTDASKLTGSYTFDMAVRADYTYAAGNYSNGYTVEAVANPTSYSINYFQNSGSDTVSNMPNTQSSESTTAPSIVLSSNTPAREHYSFLGWCEGTESNNTTTTNGIDSCNSSVTYNPGDVFYLDQKTANASNLYAMWKIDTFVQTTQVRYENADGSWGSYSTVDTSTVNYGSAYSWSTSQISGFDTTSYQSTSVASYTVTDAKTNQVSIYRTKYYLTVANSGSNITSVTGSGSYRWGQTVTVSAVKYGGTTCTSYGTPTWAKTSGTYGSLNSTSGNSVTFTMGKSAATVRPTSTSSSISQAVTIATSDGATGVKINGSTYNNGSTAYLTCGTYNIEGVYSDGYELNSWGATETRYSHTPNINNSGVASGDYTNSLSTNEVITINGASELNVSLTYQTESTNYDWVSMWAGSYPSYTAYSNYGSGIIWSGTGSTGGKYGGTTKTTLTGTVSGNAITFGFRSDGSVTNYGYYAVVSATTTGGFGDVTSNSTTFAVGGPSTISLVGKQGMPYMQDLTFDQCTAEGINVTDSRSPGVVYTVKRITLNGVPTCWMMSNLKLPKTASITPDNSNVTSAYTALSSSGNWTSSSQNDYCKPYMAVSGGEYYYNWPAATARTNSTSSTSSCYNDTSNSVGDICPKGWRLPYFNTPTAEVSNSTWISNIGANNGTTSGLATTGGFNSGSPSNVGSVGLWWTSTRYDNRNAYGLGFDGSSAYSLGYDKFVGFSVRCMMDVPIMQDFTNSACQTRATDAPITVRDRRDGSDYTVRYINGACWMTQNLRITKSTGQADWTISSTDSNFTSVSTWNVHVSDLSAGNSYTEARSHVPTATDADTNGNKPMNTYTAGQIGVWYNYCAASAGQVCSQTKTDATQDICPLNWHLPPNGTSAGQIGSVTSYKDAFNPVYGGNWYSGSLNDATTYGYWWSATAYSSNFQYSLVYNNGSLDTGSSNKRSGRYIRCTRTS